MSQLDLQLLEISLKKRWKIAYDWKGNKQNNDWDNKTKFIYETRSYSKLIERIKNLDDEIKNYALNRWYNFWSAMGIEHIFSAHKNVASNLNKFDKLKDFKIDQIPFDHKSSNFPKRFNKTISYARANKREIIEWLYKNQSQEGRKHLKNRLFVVFYNSHNQQHWKLKAEIDWIKKGIDEYVEQFSKENLLTFNFGEGEVLSDIIWLIK